jgi:hypothetical protein
MPHAKRFSGVVFIGFSNDYDFEQVAARTQRAAGALREIQDSGGCLNSSALG